MNPATGKTLAEVAACDAEDVDFAVAKAKDAFDDGRWRLLAPAERKAVLLKLAKLMEENRHELAVLESLDSGKPIRECQTVDVPDTIHTIRWHAELIDKIYDFTAPVATSALALVVREPIGVVGLRAAVELPAADARLEDRAGAGLRLLGHREAGGADLADDAARRRAGDRGRACRRASSTSSPAPARTPASRSGCTTTWRW